jgi:hypothetical protein
MLRLVFILIFIHAFYDAGCCGGHDCHPVNCDEIHDIGDGWQWRDVIFNRGALKVSADGRCHVCVPYAAMTGTCIYLPARS